MSERRSSVLGRALRALDGLRRFVVNLVFFGLMVAIVVALWSGRPKVPSGAALVLKPEGTIVEQLSSGDPVQRLVAERAGVGSIAKETLLKDLLDAVRAREGRPPYQGHLPRRRRNGRSRDDEAPRPRGRPSPTSGRAARR